MEKPKKTKFDVVGQRPATLASSLQSDGQKEVTPRSKEAKTTTARLDERRLSPEEPTSSLDSVRSLPQNFSRSYLLPFTKELLILAEKGYSLRYMLKWLLREHSVKSNLSTLSYFLKKAKQEERRQKKARRNEGVSQPSKMPLASTDKQMAAHTSVSEGSSLSEVRAAIQAVKVKSEAKTLQKDEPAFTFDQHKALIGNQQNKTN